MFDYNGQSYPPGSYSFEKPGSGCDTLVSLEINIIPDPVTVHLVTTCEGSEIEFQGKMYGQGVYSFPKENATGCDSIIILTVVDTAWERIDSN